MGVHRIFSLQRAKIHMEDHLPNRLRHQARSLVSPDPHLTWRGIPREVTPEVDPKIMGLPRYFWERGSLRSVNEYP